VNVSWSDVLAFLTLQWAFVVGCIVVIIMALRVAALTLRKPAKRILSRLNLKPEVLDDTQKQYLWEYALHEDNLFNERQNFFLVFESLLVGGSLTGFTTLLTNEALSPTLVPLLRVAGLLGVGVTLVWWYAQIKQKYVLDCLSVIHESITPAYGNVIRPIRKSGGRISSTSLLAYGFPIALALFWTVLLGLL
jgi:hypothetical protein